MVESAQEDAIGEFRPAAEEPAHDVVRLALLGTPIATGEGTALVAPDQQRAQRTSEQPPFAAEIKGHGLAIHDHRQDLGVAGQSPGLACRDPVPAVQERRDPQRALEYVEFDTDEDARTVSAQAWQPPARPEMVGQLNQRVRLGLRPRHLLPSCSSALR